MTRHEKTAAGTASDPLRAVRPTAGAADGGELLVASNRLPLTARRGPEGIELLRSSGGLVAAMEPVLAARGGTWVGSLGEGATAAAALPALPYRIVPVDVPAAEYEAYYSGFSNRTLWPILHSLVQSATFDREAWAAYDAVNARFAKAMADAPQARIAWVHDYQLLRVPLHLRALRPAQRIALFLHVPFPPVEAFRTIPWCRELLDGLLACDLVGFHVDAYARRFVECATEIAGARAKGSRLLRDGRSTQVGAFPIGIDVESWERKARSARRSVAVLAGERLVLGVDRLDYTKGLPERLLAVERLLERHPEHVGRMRFLQVAVPTRDRVEEYRRLKRRIEELVGRVNGRFATLEWSPVRYLHRSVGADQLAALYRDADVALVTPLCDGMNLVAKEYVACQVADPGVLVLSQAAGAARTLHEALIVNPHDVDGVADAMHRALEMPLEARSARMTLLRARERRHDVHHWVRRFLRAAAGSQRRPRTADAAGTTALLAAVDALPPGPLALLLDYDGTLVPIARHPAQAMLSDATRRALRACAAREDTSVAVVSGRSLEDLASMVDMPEVVLAGNHGLEMRMPDGTAWEHPDLRHYRPAIDALADQLGTLARDGAWVEEKGGTLTFHHRLAPNGLHAPLAAEARRRILAAGFQARTALCAVEARPPIAWDKGHAALHVLRALHGLDWPTRTRVACVGDDATDEDAFRALGGLAITVRVGARAVTAAEHQVPRSAVLAMLARIAQRPLPARAGTAARRA